AVQSQRIAHCRRDGPLEQHLLAERAILRSIEVDVREEVGRGRLGGKSLVVVRIVPAQSQHEPVDYLEIDLAKDRERLAVKRVAFGETCACREELADIPTRSSLERAECRVQRHRRRTDIARRRTRRSIQREGAVRKFLYEEIGIGTELGAVAELVRLIDVLVDVEGPQQHIDTIADLARQAKFLRESPDVQGLEIRVNEVSAR